MARYLNRAATQKAIWASAEVVELRFRLGWNQFTSGRPCPILNSPQRDGWRAAAQAKRIRDRALTASQHEWRNLDPSRVPNGDTSIDLQ